ncbi:50S ribosomal protein L3 [Patescibacteria group bacterium]|nr:50S ribosomal protein L3 [Patescibacteria group bacterium]MBU1931278.1 50S ribosomal protein L3 [Patescibacteria group bacterium]
MLKAIFATKIEVTQGFDQQGRRWPLTKLRLEPMQVMQVKTADKDGYFAVQCIWGQHAKIKRELRLDKATDLKVKAQISPQQILTEGDLVKVTSRSKGRGFTGVMKRWGFKGGPRTHGQSDRQRSPGSIGQGTSPGRVWKGKKMPGRSGGVQVTVRNLLVMALNPEENLIYLRGTVPGPINSWVKLTKTGKKKKLIGLQPLKSAKEESK